MLSLFFVSVGMSINLEVLASAGFAAAASVVMLVSIKAVMLFGLSRLFGLPTAAAMRIELLLPQSGEFGFVLFWRGGYGGADDVLRFRIRGAIDLAFDDCNSTPGAPRRPAGSEGKSLVGA
jgi:Kef-type K+ transport system membrane component KefB